MKTILKAKWGEADGKDIDLYTLANRKGLVAKLTNYGATLVALTVPDRKGEMGDVVVGHDNLADLVKQTGYFGATVGRVGNRIANARFELDGNTYRLAANDSPHHLHGGRKGWDKVVWAAEAAETSNGPVVKLAYLSMDGEEGYPGTVRAATHYALTNDNELRVEMEATTDRATPINMVHHTYWNLHGGPDGDIRNHELTLYADEYTPGMPPQGAVVRVAGTPFDFTKPKAIGRDLEAAGCPGAGAPVGYDSNWIVNGDPDTLRPVAKLKDPASGRVMTVEANQPGVQFYSGIFLDGSTGGKGRVHTKYAGLCIETQKFPNSINVPAWKQGAVLKPGQIYKHVMVCKFTID